MTEEQWGLWRVARCWDQPGNGAETQRQTQHGGEAAALEVEVENLRGAVFGLLQGHWQP